MAHIPVGPVGPYIPSAIRSFETTASLPASAEDGVIVFDRQTGEFKKKDGAGWTVIATGGEGGGFAAIFDSLTDLEASSPAGQPGRLAYVIIGDLLHLVLDNGSTWEPLLNLMGAMPDSIRDEEVVESALNINMSPINKGVVKLTVNENISITAYSMNAEASIVVQVVLTGSGGPWTLTFPSSWLWVGTKPASITDGAKGILTITNTGSLSSDVIASWQELGDGS